ncbi:hypothetical protein D9613_005226 [Agrocybe pediades]|uniref:DUF7962 domain-containing protein n=1 Tax=Agrocybe pediades TaxID=84607 RepID=A0A8H4VS46_9AGAR|nr:hypothetical protein D9613_005226 [Agrocybe pediades]
MFTAILGNLIVSALERRFPASKGYGTLFPSTRNGGKADTGLIKAFSKFYADSTLFPLATSLIPWDKLPEAFIKDRSAASHSTCLLLGSTIDPKALASRVPISQTTISSHLLLVEQQLSDGREWLFDTETPSLADISVHFIVAWACTFDREKAAFDPKQSPLTLQWIDRVSAWIKKQRDAQPAPGKIDGQAAAEKIVSSAHESYGVVGFDKLEATRLGISLGDNVQVAPEDSGRNYPTTGKLVALNREEIVLEVNGSKGLVRCHFPRLSFFVRPATGNKL